MGGEYLNTPTRALPSPPTLLHIPCHPHIGPIRTRSAGCKGEGEGYSPGPKRRTEPKESPGMSNEFLIQLMPLVLLFGIFYFLLIRPQQQRMKKHQEMVNAVRRGDTVVTSGGIVGRVAKVKDDGEIMVEIADGVQVRVVKATLSDVRSKAANDE